MFVGHYGISFAAKKAEPAIPLWVLFIAVQLLDVLEALLLFGAMWLYLRHRARRTAMLVFGVVMLAIQAYVFFGPPPTSDKAAAATALIAYAVFAVVIRALERRAVP